MLDAEYVCEVTHVHLTGTTDARDRNLARICLSFRNELIK
jgi:hypothetical protein